MNIMNMVSEERTFGVEIEFVGASKNQVIEAVKSQGLEIEYEGYTHTTTSYWKIVTDSSVHGNSNEKGLELVSPILKGLDGVNQINKVCIALNSVGAKVNKTCGLHLHLDARDLVLKDWKNILVFYYNYQRGINQMLPKSRRDNSYCASYSEIEMEKILSCKTLEDLFDTCYDRYKVINLKSFLRHGTVEFRAHSGTTEFEKIVEWLQFCLCIVAKAKSAKSTLPTFINESVDNEFDLMLHYLKKVGMDNTSVAYYRKRKEQLSENTTSNLRECV